MKRIILVVILVSAAVLPLFSEEALTQKEYSYIQSILEKQGYTVNPPKADGVDDYNKDWFRANTEKPVFSYDLYFRTLMSRGSNFSLGGGLNMGIQTSSFRFEGYLLGDYFLKPLGGEGGAASLEFATEVGAMFGWKMLEAWRTRTYVCLDVGYYSQHVIIPQDPDTLFTGFNGIMFRPRVETHIQITRGWDMSIGLFYQFPLYPAYSDYKGIGVTVGLL